MLISYLPNGDVQIDPRPAGLAAVNDLVGDPGMAIVRLHHQHNLMGFVNDCGHLVGMERNVPGSLILAALGAGTQPYAGPVVITGWDWDATAQDRSEITDLTGAQITILGAIHGAVHVTISDGKPAELLRPTAWAHAGEALRVGLPADIVEQMRAYADRVRTAPRPQIEVLHDEEALNYLFGRRP